MGVDYRKSDTVVKARYVAQGYAQYVEPDDVCATTLSPTTPTIVSHNCDTTTISHADVGCLTAFLHAKRSEEKPIYIQPPMEFYEEESTVWRVKRAVYGLKDKSTRMARLFCDDDDQESGNDTITNRRDLFTERIGNKLIMLLVYVR